MAYTLEYREEDGLLRVEVSGERTVGHVVDDAQAAWREITGVCMNSGLARILIVSRVTGAYPALDAHEISSNLHEVGVQRGWKIAFVTQDEGSYGDLKFAETVAVNWGFFARVFDDEEEARRWVNQRA